MKIVIAGNYNQYLHWLRETGTSREDARYIDQPQRIYGLRDVEVVKIGTWYEQHSELLDLLEWYGKSHNFKFIN